MPLILRDPRDPPVRDDALCVVCERERKPGQRREPHYSTARADPFCSAECARAWYGVSLETNRRGIVGKDASLAPSSPRSFGDFRRSERTDTRRERRREHA